MNGSEAGGRAGVPTVSEIAKRSTEVFSSSVLVTELEPELEPEPEPEPELKLEPGSADPDPGSVVADPDVGSVFGVAVAGVVTAAAVVSVAGPSWPGAGRAPISSVTGSSVAADVDWLFVVIGDSSADPERKHAEPRCGDSVYRV
ncbi:hypothetical protein Acsp01_49470 [Actinoplanes sp. NBRC 101535]|nr:hypothetical protein Acsp01_49470 [Actinoplanes sp. NBRC 101535]